jgi:hypothetical protein
VAEEDQRQLHRELQELKDDRTRHSNRTKGLLASQGLALEVLDESLPEWLPTARLWDGTALGADLQHRLVREWQRWQFVHGQVLELSRERSRRLRCDATPQVDKVRQLLGLAGIGINGAWLLVNEFFGWRKLHNRKQAGALVRLTGTPYHSGNSEHEQGISKAGSRRMRKMLVELAWCWLRWDPWTRGQSSQGLHPAGFWDKVGPVTGGEGGGFDGCTALAVAAWPGNRGGKSGPPRSGRTATAAGGSARVRAPAWPAAPAASGATKGFFPKSMPTAEMPRLSPGFGEWH